MSQTNEKRWSDVHKDLVQDMTLMDDKFMHEVFNDRKCVEAVLREIFDDSSLEITLPGHRKNWITSLAKVHKWMSLPRAGLLFSTT